MNNFIVRSITGILYVIITISSIVIGPWCFASVMFVVSCISLWEFYDIVSKKNHPMKFQGMLLGVLSYIAISLVIFNVISLQWLLLLILPITAMYIFILYAGRSNPISDLGITILGVLYIIFPLSLINQIYIYSIDYAIEFILPLGFFVMLWLNDSGAYIVGSSIGRHRLFERVSPKKSWEGFFGGALAAIIGGTVIAFFFSEMNLLFWIAYAVIITIFATFGDLVESLIKRYLGIKDSGKILPGHGGMLDRFDGVFLSVPIIVVFLMILNSL